MSKHIKGFKNVPGKFWQDFVLNHISCEENMLSAALISSFQTSVGITQRYVEARKGDMRGNFGTGRPTGTSQVCDCSLLSNAYNTQNIPGAAV